MGADTTNLDRTPLRRNGVDPRRSTTKPRSEDFRFLCNVGIYDFPAALHGLANAANTSGYPDIAYKLGTLAGDPMMYRYTIDPEAIRKEIRRERFSTHGANDFYCYDKAVVLFSELYRFCRGGYATAVRHAKNEAAWQYGYEPGPEPGGV